MTITFTEYINKEIKNKEKRRQITIIDGQFKGIESETKENPVKTRSKRFQEMFIEQKEQRCNDLR